MTIDAPNPKIAAFAKKIDRLEKARHHAEQLLEAKSAELYEIQRGMEATIEERTRTLHEKVTELESLKQQLETERDRAVQESANKTTLFAKLSHEIRTPLNGIVGTLNLLTEAVKQPAEKDLVGHATRACDHLKAILNDAIDLAKLEHGMVTLEAAPVNLVSFLEDVLYFWQLQANSDQRSLSLHIATSGISTISIDAGRLRQILDNLLSNAIKYGGDGPITLSAEVDGVGPAATLTFSVTDTGNPLSKEQQQTIFDPYFQAGADTGLEAIGSGAGLGLAICRELVHVMGAEIQTSHSTEQKGNVFSVRFDLSPLSPRFGRSRSLSGQSQEGQAAESAAIVKERRRTPRNGSDKLTVDGRAPRALIVEDVPTNQMILENYLRRWGILPEVVENGLEAVELVAKQEDHPFDIILMDIAMPVMDGYEATRRIKQMEGSAGQTPVIGVSAHVGPEDTRTMLETGMVASVGKPIERSYLFGLLAELFHQPTPSIPPTPSTPSYNRGFAEDFPQDLKAQLFEDIESSKAEVQSARAEGVLEGVRSGLHKLKSLTGTFNHPAFSDVKELYEDLCHPSASLDAAAVKRLETILEKL